MSRSPSCLYVGTITHQRLRPKRHHLRYRVFNLLLDIDELPQLSSSLRLFAYNRLAPVAFFDRDHGSGGTALLRPWVEQQLAQAEINLSGGPIRLLCYPRVFGYGFNPLTIYFCHYCDGRLAALLWEVNNTFGERHTYVIPVEAESSTIVRQECRKTFYVSPFIAVEGSYRFHVMLRADTLCLGILQSDISGRSVLHARLEAQQRPLDDRNLASCLLHYPLMTLKVICGIYFEALRLWWKGVPVVRRPPPPAQPVTIVLPRRRFR